MQQMTRAVQERSAKGPVEGDDPVRARWRQLGWFATPPWATRAGAEILKRIDPGIGDARVLDPACGDGIMVRALGEYFTNVAATDIEPCGAFRDFRRLDFLAPEIELLPPCRWVFTNPPFHLAEQFIRRGLSLADRGVMILARMAFLETQERYTLMRDHLTHFAPFTERVGMQLGPWNPGCDTATAYAWFVFDKERMGRRSGPRMLLIPPGTRGRLTKPDDCHRFTHAAPAPLLDGDAAGGG